MFGLIISILFLSLGGERDSNLDSYLRNKLSEYKKYEYEVISLPSYVESINDERIKISPDRELKINYGYAYVPVDIKISNENTSQSVITLKLNLFDEVFVANKRIRRGDIISSSDFTIKEKEITHLRNNTVKSFERVNNHQATMNIAEGSILQENMLESLPDIKAGYKIFAYSTVGTIIVTFPVTVREDGRIGEEVRVVREDGLIFKALVESSEKVKIIE